MILRRDVASRWGIVLLAMIAIVLGAPSVSAQETSTAPTTESRSGLSQGFDDCKDKTTETAVLDQLVKDGKITKEERDEAEGTFRQDSKKIDEIKKANEDRWKEIEEHYEKESGLTARAGNVAENAACGVAAPLNAAGNALQNRASEFWDSAVGEFVDSVLEGNMESLATLMTFWMDFSTTSVNIDANTQGVKNIVMGLSGLALAASFVIGGWRIAASRRGGLQEGMEDLNENMLRWLIFSIAVPAMFPGAMVASDALADAIMNEFGSMEGIVELGGLQDSEFGPIIMLIFAGIMIAGSFVQILALVVRVLIAPIAAGLTPLFAALSFTETGKQGLNHLVSLLIACIVFKPVAALLYAVVLWNVSGDGVDGAAGGVINALMIGVAGFSAPMLIRMIVPAVSQAGGGGSAPMLAGATGVMAGAAGMAGASLAKVGRGVGALGGSAAGTGARGPGSSSGPSSAGTGISGPAGPAGRSGAGGAGAASQPSGSGGGSGSSGSRSGASSPSGSTASRAAGAGRAGARTVGRGISGAGSVAVAASRASGGVSRAATGSQRLFDESMGVPGNYAGQAHR